MNVSRWVIACAISSVIVGCARQPTETSIGTSHASGAHAYATVRELLSGVDQAQPREQLLAIAAFIRRWERDPFGPTSPPNPDEDPSTLAMMRRWLTLSRDVSVTLCASIPSIAEEQAGEGAAMGFMLGASFGMAAYMIENPNEAADPDGDRVQGAGIESGLLWVEAHLRRGQATGAPILDELFALRAAGGRAALQRYHAEHIRCGRHQGEPLPTR